MILLSAIPASVTVTNQLSEDIVIHHNTRLSAGTATVITLAGRSNSEKTELWNSLRAIQLAGTATSATTFDVITDPVESEHRTTGGHETAGAITPE